MSTSIMNREAFDKFMPLRTKVIDRPYSCQERLKTFQATKSPFQSPCQSPATRPKSSMAALVLAQDTPKSKRKCITDPSTICPPGAIESDESCKGILLLTFISNTSKSETFLSIEKKNEKYLHCSGN